MAASVAPHLISVAPDVNLDVLRWSDRKKSRICSAFSLTYSPKEQAVEAPALARRLDTMKAGALRGHAMRSALTTLTLLYGLI